MAKKPRNRRVTIREVFYAALVLLGFGACTVLASGVLFAVFIWFVRAVRFIANFLTGMG